MLSPSRVVSPSRWRWLTLLLSALLTATVLTAFSPASRAQAAELPGTIIDGGYIISDAEFYRAGSMTESQIQSFLNGKVGSCASGATCLKNYRGQLTARSADSYCKAIAGESSATAARMIYRAANACGVNPKVILVMLQKEQGLVTSTKPSDWNLEHAMGQSCPDTPAGCSAAAAGFWNQVYLGSRQMQIYTKYPSSFSYRAGRYNTIKWAPSSACGSSKVFIKNQATANLYNYTPYRPNIAALAAGWGTGDSCSTYGNRNFYNYYVAWFAPGASTSTGAPAQISACTKPAAADVATRSQTGKVNVEALNARTAPTTLCDSGIRSLAKGTKVAVTGVYGAWSQITVSGANMWVVSSYLALDPTSGDGAPAVTGCAQPASVTAASGTAVVTVSSLNARTAPTTDCDTGLVSIRQGQKYTRTGTYGAWWRLTIGGKAMWAHSDYLALESSTPKPVATVSRISGDDRFETAVAVSKAAHPGPVGTVYLATGMDYADALTAAPAAVSRNAALLLTLGGSLPDPVAAELRRLAPKSVILVGGTGALDSKMPDRVKAALKSVSPTVAVTRAGGQDRYETARILAAGMPASKTVYIATGNDYPDAMSASAPAASNGSPILLVNAKAGLLDTDSVALVKSRGVTTAFLIGGDAVVPAAVATQLASLKITVKRYGGHDRYATNAAVVKGVNGASATRVGVATGADYPDALTGAALAGQQKMPMFLSPATCLGRDAYDYLLNSQAGAVTLFGGTGVLSARVSGLQRC
jgi:putative cell wall-binding protein